MGNKFQFDIKHTLRGAEEKKNIEREVSELGMKRFIYLLFYSQSQMSFKDLHGTFILILKLNEYNICQVVVFVIKTIFSFPFS